ncbi:hypothetical protein SteCoe_10328 [Stentor coeruleus]|uniref:Calcineurin-like phosphoesterase domain-containing protein n=1 Tax=Stentor coeruleus TaxID=5963 RepID=A0A1R2CFP3_9CILI|nr:hypothetical protein SteCoe_10328 [Stentor coeruleus]
MPKITQGRIIGVLLSISLLILAYSFIKFHTLEKSPTSLETLTVASNETLRFHVIGDYGLLDPVYDYPILPLKSVATAMGKRAESYPISMIMTTGDNIYPQIDSLLDSKFFKVFEEIFKVNGLLNIPWYLAYGNHDCYYSNNFGETLSKLYPQLSMPTAPWNLTLNMSNFSVSLTFLSCNLHCHKPTPNPYLIKYCNSVNPSNSTFSEYSWLESHLKSISSQSHITWNLVFIHYPIFSASAGFGDTDSLQKYLFPLLQKYQVDAVFSGHTHNMQYFVANKTVGFVHQNYSMNCYKKSHIICKGIPKMCWNHDVECEEDKCENKLSFEGMRERINGDRNQRYKKGEYIHQIVQGASGGLLDPLCELDNPMALPLFGIAEYGFTEVELSKDYMKTRFILANSSRIEYETVIYREDD